MELTPMPTSHYEGEQQQQEGIPCEVEGLKDLLEGEVLAIPEDDQLTGFLA